MTDVVINYEDLLELMGIYWNLVDLNGNYLNFTNKNRAIEHYDLENHHLKCIRKLLMNASFSIESGEIAAQNGDLAN